MRCPHSTLTARLLPCYSATMGRPRQVCAIDSVDPTVGSIGPWLRIVFEFADPFAIGLLLLALSMALRATALGSSTWRVILGCLLYVATRLLIRFGQEAIHPRMALIGAA